MSLRRNAPAAFTLVELLVTIAIIGILAGLLLAALSHAKATAHSATCKNHLHQMGVALQMYVDENAGRYPYLIGARDASLETSASTGLDRNNSRFWWAKLATYYPLPWTNAAYHCPGYRGLIGGMEVQKSIPTSGAPFGSYAYNACGVSMLGFGKPFNPDLGLGYLPPNFRVNNNRELGRNPVREPRVLFPSEMFSIGESRFVSLAVNKLAGGQDLSRCGLVNWRGTAAGGWFNYQFDPARHGKTYNQLLCDGHVIAMAPSTLFDPAKTAAMWNRDHQPHPELWVP